MRPSLIHSYYYSQSITSEYQAVLSRGTALGYTGPSAAQKTKDNTFLSTIKAGGLLAKALCGKMFATDADSDFATIDWVNPTDVNKQAEKVNSPSFTAGSGFNSDGSTSYLLSGLFLADITQNSVTYCARGFINDAAGARALFGAAEGATAGSGSILVNTRNASDQATANVSDTTNSVMATGVTDGTGRVAIARSGNTKYLSINGAAFASAAVTFGALTTPKEIALLAVNGSSVFNHYSRGISYFWVFNGKLSDAEIALFDAAMAAYLS